MKRRDMSARKFAEFLGINHEVVNKFIDLEKSSHGLPSTQTIVRIAKATNTDPGALLNLIVSDTAGFNFLDADALVLSQQIRNLPDNIRAAISILIAGSEALDADD